MKQKFKRGAASFYIVAFSTLILVVLATSFALVIMSEVARTANDDLSQSAYDSALAGVEDAKVAYSNYRKCIEAGETSRNANINSGKITCADIIYWFENPDCYMVGHILGKIDKGQQHDVVVGGIEKTIGGEKTSSTNQAYTCVKINTSLVDYRATLSQSKVVQTVRAGVGDGETNKANKIKLSWYSVKKDVDINKNRYKNYAESTDASSGKTVGKVVFPESSGDDITTASISAPPTIELQIVQTALRFSLDDFDIVDDGRTDRATLYLVPTWNWKSAVTTATGDGYNYEGVYTGSDRYNGVNKVAVSQVVKTNDRSVKNKPFLVYCDPNPQEDFYCSAEVELPGVIHGGDRSNYTFMLSLSLPYQQPDTDFSIEICDENGCGANAIQAGSNEADIKISNSQIAVDSTGRANDLYRRVETRLETTDATFNAGYPYYALEVLGDNPVEKKMPVAYEPPNPFYF